MSSWPKTSPVCMHDFASSQTESLCIVVPARDAIEHLKLNAGRMEISLTWRKDHLPWLTLHPTYCLYGLEHATLFVLSMKCIIAQIYNKKSKAEIHAHRMVHPNIKRNSCFHKGCPFLAYIYTLKKKKLVFLRSASHPWLPQCQVFMWHVKLRQ